MTYYTEAMRYDTSEAVITDRTGPYATWDDAYARSVAEYEAGAHYVRVINEDGATVSQHDRRPVPTMSHPFEVIR